MAIFPGEDMVDVTTPDGRTLTLPRSIVPASMMPQQQQIAPAQPSTPPVNGAGAYAQPAELAPPALPAPVDPPPGIVEEGDPEVMAVETMEPLNVKSRPAVMKKLKAHAESPAGKLEAVQTQQTAAANDEATAIVSMADTEAAEQAVVGEAVAERNTALNKLFVKREQDMMAAAQAEDSKLNEVTGLRKKIAGTKISREADHPIMAAVFAALAGIGSAMKGEKVDTLDILYTAIDRKVAAQTADLDQLGKVYGMTKEELAMLKDKSKSKLEFHNAMIAGETEKAVRHIEEITARSASEKTKANAKIIVAQLNQRVADKTMEATRWGLDFGQKDKHHKAQIGLGYSNLAETKRSNLMSEQLTREKLYADKIAALAAAKASGDDARFKATMEAGKEAETRGIVGADNEYLLTAVGREKLAQAAKLEAEAQATEEKHKGDPMATGVTSTRVQLLRQKAAELRGDARSFDVVKMRDTAEAKALSKKYAAAQTMMDTVDEIKMLYDEAGRGVISRSKLQQGLQAKMGLLSVAAKDAWELGAWDKGSAALVATITGKDPTDGLDTGYITSHIGLLIGNDPEGFKNRLEAVTVKLEQDVRQQIHKGGGKWDGEDALFTRKESPLSTPTGKAVADLTQARSGVELQKSADEVGTVGRAVRKVAYPFSPSHREEADNRQSTKYHGLSKDQDAPFGTLLTEYKNGNTKAGDQLVAEVINTSAKRPDLAVPLLHNLREHAPSLYTAARVGLPKGSAADEQMNFEEKNQIGVGVTPTKALASAVLNSVDNKGVIQDEVGLKELGARAGKKDPEAVRALSDILTRKTQNKSLPQGSVFRGGR